MIASFKELKPYLVLLRDNPLLVAAIIFSSLLSMLFVSLQPMLIKTFLNGVSDKAGSEFLAIVVTFILVGVIIGYIFDFVAVGLRFLLELNFNQSLYRVFSQSSLGLSEEAFEFSMTDGLPRITESVLKISLDLFFQFFNLVLISFFLFLESKVLGIASIVFFIIGQLVSLGIVSSVSRFSRFEVKAKEKLIRSLRSSKPITLTFSFFRYYLNMFGLNSTIFFISYFLFQVLPVIFLFFYLKLQFLSVGSITSVLIYIGMLAVPYNKIVEIFKYVNTSVVVTRFIRKDLEYYLALLDETENIDRGLILLPQDDEGSTKHSVGIPVKTMNETSLINGNLFYEEDNSDQDWLEALRQKSYREKIFLAHPKKKKPSVGHFVYDFNQKKFETVLSYD